MRHITPVRILVALAAVIVTTFTQCGKFANSRTYQQQKMATISSNAVFAPNDAGNGVRVPEPNEPGEGTPPPPPPPPPPVVVVPAPPTKLPVELYCSAEGAGLIGSTLMTSPPDLNYAFQNASGAVVCSFTEAGARDDLINTSRVNIADLAKKCPALKDGNYVMTLKSPLGGGSMLMTLVNMGELERADPVTAGVLGQNWIGHPLHVDVKVGADKGVTLTVTDKRPCDDLIPNHWLTPLCPGLYGDLAAKVLSSTLNAYSQAPAGARCAYSVSPIIFRLAPQNAPIRLSPPLAGIDFDIMGINAVPPHAPKRISWFTAETAKEDYFLVLPDRQGRVTGIDQMFGNNTLQPDGNKPPKEWNGYAALRQHDGRRHDGSIDERARDGFITTADEVFRDLRLWRDVNRNGVADPGELSTLDEHQIERIDLDFVDGVFEKDDYGNESRMKSTVQTRDGRQHLVYDLWFRGL